MTKVQISYNPNLPWTGEFLLYEADGTTPTDISGASFRMHIRKDIDSLDILAQASTSDGKITTITDGIKISLTATDTLTMAQTGYKCGGDLEITYSPNEVVPEIIEFEFIANKSYTRDYHTN